MKINYPLFRNLLLVLTIPTLFACGPEAVNQANYDKALENGLLANEGYRRCNAYVQAWLEYADPETG